MFIEYITTNKPSRKLALDVFYMIKFRDKSRFLRKYFERKIYYKYNCEKSHQANIDSTIKFGHPIGIVIGSNVTINEDCTVYQNVTLGANFMKNNDMPNLKKGVIVGVGAKIIGGVTVGNNVVVGANAVVTKNIPDNSIVTGVNCIRPR